MVNVNKLRGKMVERAMNVTSLAKEMQINQATLYRKMESGNFTIKEARRIAEVLNLEREEVNDIFFADYVA